MGQYRALCRRDRPSPLKAPSPPKPTHEQMVPLLPEQPSADFASPQPAAPPTIRPTRPTAPMTAPDRPMDRFASFIRALCVSTLDSKARLAPTFGVVKTPADKARHRNSEAPPCATTTF